VGALLESPEENPTLSKQSTANRIAKGLSRWELKADLMVQKPVTRL